MELYDGHRPTMEVPAVQSRSTNRADSDRRLIYIAGFGRSGSTTLDIALSSHPDLAGLGEATDALRILAEGDADVPELWRRFASTTTIGDNPTQLRSAAKTVANIERLVPGPFARNRRRDRRRYLEIQRAMFDKLFELTGATGLVDSSKTSWLHTWRLPLLAKVVPDVHCIILVRDLPGVVRSVRRGHGDTLEPHRLPTVRTLIGWPLATLTAALIGSLVVGRERTRLVSYDDVANDPENTLIELFGWLDLNPAGEAIAAGLANGFLPSDQIGGNRVRNSDTVRIRPSTPSAPLEQTAARLAVAAVSSAVLSVLRLTTRRLQPTSRVPPRQRS